MSEIAKKARKSPKKKIDIMAMVRAKAVGPAMCGFKMERYEFRHGWQHRMHADDSSVPFVAGNFLRFFSQAAQQTPTLFVVLQHPQSSHVAAIEGDIEERFARIEERCNHLEGRLSDLTQKIREWQPLVCYRPDTRKRFNDLVHEWRSTRGHASKIKDLVANSAYQQIIGMGEPAIPLILEEMERQPGHWSWALRAISGEDPIPQSARGRLNQEATIWLQWGREKKFR